MLPRRVITGLAVTVAAAALSACGGGGEPAAKATTPAKADATEVTIKAFNFQPDPVTVKAGTTVTFVNQDQIHHTATAGTRKKPTPGVFNAKMEAAPGPGKSTEAKVTLDKPGTYDYFCKFHPGNGMTAKLIVK